MPIDREDIQGLILQGYGYPFARLMLLSFPNEERGKAFLRWVRPRLTSGKRWEEGAKPEPLVNLGLTYNGLKSVGIQSVLQTIDPKLVLTDDWRNPFPDEFRHPLNAASLGDYPPDDDASRWWNGVGQDAMFPRLHAMVQIYAQQETVIDDTVAAARARARDLGVEEVVTGTDRQPLGGRALERRKVHFGYLDSVAQPDVDWENATPAPGKIDRRNFLLGDPTSAIPSSPDPLRTGDLFRNSCYLAFRWVAQDVPAFEQFLTDNAPKVAPGKPLAEARELLAAKLVGRWRSGAPLVLTPEQDDPLLAERDDFAYRDSDPNGFRCPFSAHIRVTNPRDQRLAAHVSPIVPRVIRRGVSYGPEWKPGVNDHAERGLLGMFLCASPVRQFELLVRWMKNNDFSPVFDGVLPTRRDPLFTSDPPRAPSPLFRIPTKDGPVEVPLLKSFTRSRGTAYFLLPSLRLVERLMK
jgi:Dyp-type peroxidase family